MKLRRRKRGGEGVGVGEACAHSCVAAALLREVKLDPRRRIHARLLHMHLVDTSFTCWVSVERG